VETAGSPEHGRRRAWRGPALATVACLLALVGLILLWGARSFGEASAGYVAKTLCSCIFVAGRDADGCRREDLDGYDYVDTRVDRAARTVEARSLLVGHARAEYLGPRGCTLE
jgi:hypothetical protein